MIYVVNSLSLFRVLFVIFSRILFLSKQYKRLVVHSGDHRDLQESRHRAWTDAAADARQPEGRLRLWVEIRQQGALWKEAGSIDCLFAYQGALLYEEEVTAELDCHELCRDSVADERFFFLSANVAWICLQLIHHWLGRESLFIVLDLCWILFLHPVNNFKILGEKAANNTVWKNCSRVKVYFK